MSAELTQIAQELSKQRQTLSRVMGMVQNAPTVDAVQDLRARVEAAKGWARTYKQTKHLRLDFLRIEISALVRLHELDGLDHLTASEADAAKFLAGLTVEERNEIISSAGNVTTAAGLVRSWQKNREAASKFKRETAEWAQRFSSDAPYPEYSEDELNRHRNRHGWYMSRAVLADYLDELTAKGEPFTVQDVVDTMVDSSIFADDIEDHPVLREGLAEVARKAINSAPPEMWGDTVIPKLVTTFLPHENELVYVRIPVMSSKVWDVEQMIKYRKAQIEQDRKAVARLEEFHQRLLATGASPDANVGAILMKEAVNDAA